MPILAVKARLSCPVGTDAETGEMFAIDNPITEIPWIDKACEHGATVCMECASSWASDYDLEGAVVVDAEGVIHHISREQIQAVLDAD
jgi:hypothetical protein